MTNYKKIQLTGITFLAATAGFILLAPETANAGILDSANQTLRTQDDFKSAWNFLLNLVNVTVALVVVMIAMSEILHLNVDTYGVKKMIPSLVLAIIGANFSYLFVMFIIDIGDAVALLFASQTMYNVNQLWSPEWLIDPGNYISLVGWSLVTAIYQLAIALLKLYLWLLLILRDYMLFILAIVGPLAFAALAIPQTKSLFTKWFDYLIKFAFMKAAIYGILFLGGILLGALQEMPIIAGIVAFATYVGAATLPGKMNGEIMGKWQGTLTGLAKRGWNATGGAMVTGGLNRGNALGRRLMNQQINSDNPRNPIARVGQYIRQAADTGRITTESIHKEADALRDASVNRAYGQMTNDGRYIQTNRGRQVREYQARAQAEATTQQNVTQASEAAGNRVYSRTAAGRQEAQTQEALKRATESMTKSTEAINKQSIRTAADMGRYDAAMNQATRAQLRLTAEQNRLGEREKQQERLTTAANVNLVQDAKQTEIRQKTEEDRIKLINEQAKQNATGVEFGDIIDQREIENTNKRVSSETQAIVDMLNEAGDAVTSDQIEQTKLAEMRSTATKKRSEQLQIDAETAARQNNPNEAAEVLRAEQNATLATGALRDEKTALEMQFRRSEGPFDQQVDQDLLSLVQQREASEGSLGTALGKVKSDALEDLYKREEYVAEHHDKLMRVARLREMIHRVQSGGALTPEEQTEFVNSWNSMDDTRTLSGGNITAATIGTAMGHAHSLVDAGTGNMVTGGALQTNQDATLGALDQLVADDPSIRYMFDTQLNAAGRHEINRASGPDTATGNLWGVRGQTVHLPAALQGPAMRDVLEQTRKSTGKKVEEVIASDATAQNPLQVLGQMYHNLFVGSTAAPADPHYYDAFVNNVTTDPRVTPETKTVFQTGLEIAKREIGGNERARELVGTIAFNARNAQLQTIFNSLPLPAGENFSTIFPAGLPDFIHALVTPISQSDHDYARLTQIQKAAIQASLAAIPGINTRQRDAYRLS